MFDVCDRSIHQCMAYSRRWIDPPHPTRLVRNREREGEGGRYDAPPVMLVWAPRELSF